MLALKQEKQMYVKLMSCEDAPDHDTRKRFRLLGDVSGVDFERVAIGGADGGSFPQARVTFRDGTVEHFSMEGNAYVMSDEGKTISSFGHGWIPGTACAPASEQHLPPAPAVTERGGV
jgi:hypothetical protein